MKSKVSLNIIVEDDAWTEAVDFNALKVADELAELAFGFVEDEAEGKHEILSRDVHLELNVCLSNDEAIHKLNKEFRGMDKPTNVLSFANIDDDAFWDSLDDAKPGQDKDVLVALGDIILAFETLKAEAEAKKISMYAHYCHLLVHGFLHILGYDHQDDAEAEEMEALETEILAAFSVDDPYGEDE